MSTPLPDRVRDLRSAITNHQTVYTTKKREWDAARQRAYSLNTRRADLSRDLVLALLGRGWTQQRIADGLGVTQQRVHQVAYGRLIGKRAFPLETIERLAGLLEREQDGDQTEEAAA